MVFEEENITSEYLSMNHHLYSYDKQGYMKYWCSLRGFRAAWRIVVKISQKHIERFELVYLLSKLQIVSQKLYFYVCIS